jgi:hypothetical protein
VSTVQILVGALGGYVGMVVVAGTVGSFILRRLDARDARRAERDAPGATVVSLNAYRRADCESSRRPVA